MANPFNGSARGKRGGRKDRPSRRDFEPKHKASSSALIPDQVGIFWDCLDGETKEDYLIPRTALTVKQHLELFPVDVETETLQAKQLDQHSNKLVQTTDERAVWTSDRSLLKQGKPDQFGGPRGTRFKRETSGTKRIVTEIEKQETFEIEVDPDLEDL